VRRLRLVASLSALLALNLACFAHNDSEHPTTGGAAATFTVRNQTQHEICYVNMWPSSEEMTSGDWLGPSETIPPGRSRTFNTTAGTWHVRMQDCAHTMLFDRDGISIEGSIQLDFTTIERPAS
jgi:hypothetical protein